MVSHQHSTEEQRAAAGVRTVTVSVTNSSDTTLVLSTAMLTGGIWLPSTPVINSDLRPGGQLIVDNQSVDAFSLIGGTLAYTPSNGGNLNMSWVWPFGQGLTVSGSALSQTLTIVSSGYNTSSLNATASFVVTPLNQ